MNIGFIGLGNLGRAIAGRLLEQNVPLTVWNRTPGKLDHPRAQWASNPVGVIKESDLVFMCLFDGAAVDEVLNGPEGLLTGDCRHKIIVDLTTNHFGSVVAFHNGAHERGAYYLEAPVLGSVVPASQGMLTILVSGDHTAYGVARPYLDKIGQDIYYLEKPGLASKLKVINNLVLGSFMAVLAEAVALGEAAGLPREEVLGILASGAGNSGVLKAKTNKLKAEDFSPHFSTAAIYKDLHYVKDLARSLGRPVFTAGVMEELYGRAMAQGLEDRDFSVIYRVLKETS